MILTFDKSKQRAATWRGVKADPQGRTGIIVSLVLCIAAPLAAVMCSNAISSSWGGSWDYDPWVVGVLALIVASLFLVAAFVVFRLSWKYHSSGVGGMRNQMVAIDPGWMTYSFSIAGDLHFNARNIIVVRLASQETAVHKDQATGVVRVEGGVWRYFDMDVTQPGTKMFLADGTALAPTYGAVPPVDQLERIGSFFIPDSFTPDLYQIILANYLQ